MMRRLTRMLMIAGLVCGLASAGFAQRPHGTIQGRVLDPAGKPLANAVVLIYGTTLQGSLVFITDSSGSYRFLSLLPGVYSLRAELPEHKSLVWEGISLGLGQSLDWNPVLEPNPDQVIGTEEEVQVKKTSPMIDVQSASFRTEFDSLLLTTLPTNRDLYDYQNAAPGAVSEDAEFLRTSSILGGTVRGQVYKVDGAFVNDPIDMALLINVPPDVLDVVGFELAGHPAESGQASSASLNIITKSPRNSMTVGLQALVGGSDFNHDLYSRDEVAALGMSPTNKYSSFWDMSFSLGGPVLEDLLWLYATGRRLSWSRKNPYQPEDRMASISPDSPHYDLTRGEWTGLFRTAFAYQKILRYTGMVQFSGIYEPVYFPSATPQASKEFTTVLKNGSDLLTTHAVNYILNPSIFLDVRGTYFTRTLPIRVQDEGETASAYDYTQDVYFGSGFYEEDVETTRLSGVASLTAFADGFLGARHEFKAGFEFEQSETLRDWYKANQFRTYWYDYASGNPYYYSPELKQGRLSFSPCPAGSAMWTPKVGIRRFAGYLQDSLQAGRLALNLGVHVDYSYIHRPGGSRSKVVPVRTNGQMNPDVSIIGFISALATQAEAEGLPFPMTMLTYSPRKLASFFTLSPRFGAVLDLWGDARTALKVSAARYYEPFWVGLYNYDSVLAPTSVDFLWTDLNENGLMDMPDVDSYVYTHYPNQDTTVSTYDENLKAPYTDELNLGLEQQLFPDFKVGLNLIYKTDKNIIDSYDANNGYDPTATDEVGPIWLPFTFTEPGSDAVLGTADDQSLTVYGLRADRPLPSYRFGNIAGAKREYKAAILSFVKRLSHQWEMQGSLTFSSYKGNIGAGYTDTDLENTAFNDPNTLINAYGPLAFDRPVQFKLMGTVILPWEWVLSAYFQAYSGIPWHRTLSRVYFPADFGAEYGGVQTPYAVVNAETPGTHRYEAYLNLDLHLEKRLSIGGDGRVSLIADIFNVLGRRGQMTYTDQAGTLHYDILPVTYQTAANFGSLASLYGVRALRIGLRIGV